ncbi:hypothetical protein [Lacticaseibacillus jixiensis]|uniref:hypothetical protein n=1 Tax=Lacticaseibacillus jixiensis TaxID=3231926 RepID=UPI0036F1C721
MGILSESQDQMEAIVRALGYEPDGNYLLAYNRLNNVAKTGAWLFFKPPLLDLALAAEKRHVIIFTPEALVIHRLKKNGLTQVFSANEITDFQVRDGANKSIVIDFTHGGNKFSFYTYKDFSMRLKYAANNLVQLSASHFMGYAKGI